MIRDELPTGVEMTSVEDAVRFVAETGVDLFAPAVGNMHGVLRGSFNPPLNIERIGEIGEAVSVPLVLHGGSGTPNIAEAIKAGISEVHISTELRRAWRDALFAHLQSAPDDIAPYKASLEARDAVEAVVTKHLQAFKSA